MKRAYFGVPSLLLTMKCKHTADYKKKYKYDKFEFTVPELAEVFEPIVDEWVSETNMHRRNAVAELKSTNSDYNASGKKTKKEIKEDLKMLKDDWDTDYRPVTREDFDVSTYNRNDWRQIQRIFIGRRGTFEFTIPTEMSIADKVKGFVEKKKAKAKGGAK